MKNLEYISGIFLRSDDQTIDIINIVEQIDIYQNINESLVTGSVILHDTSSSRLSKLFRESIVGKGEELTFALRTSTKPASKSKDLDFKKYYIYKVSILPLESVGGGLSKQVIVLNFSSTYMFLNEFRKVTNSYYDTLSNIASKIAENQLGIKLTDIEDTKDKQYIIIPNLSPLQSICWLAARSYSTPETNQNFDIASKMWNAASSVLGTSNIPDIVNNNYVFYEDIDHNFHFRSIGSMFLKEPVIGEVGKNGIILKVRSRSSINDYSASFDAIHHTSKSVSPITNLKNGMYAATNLTFDLTRKKYAKQTMSYKDLFSTQTHLYPKQLIDPTLDPELNIMNNIYNHPEAVQKYNAKSSYLFSQNENPLMGNTPTNNVDKWLLRRIASMEAMDQQGIDLELRGNVGIQLGDIVMFSTQHINKSISLEFSKFEDNFFVGKFLITKIKHSIEYNNNQQGYTMRTFLSLRRDCDYGGQ